jgi:hypothetical protein
MMYGGMAQNALLDAQILGNQGRSLQIFAVELWMRWLLCEWGSS